MRNDVNFFTLPDVIDNIEIKTPRIMARIKKTMAASSRSATDVAGERLALRRMLQNPIGFSDVAAEAILQAG